MGAGQAFASLLVPAMAALTVALAVSGCAVSSFDLAGPAVTTTKSVSTKPVASSVVEDASANSVALGTASAVISEPGAPARAPVKVGLILPLTGPGQAALVAASMKEAAELALRDLNASHVQLVIRDDKGSPEGAIAATNEVLAEGAELILGPLFAKSVNAATAAARAKAVPIIAFSNDRQVAGSATHLLSFLAGPEVTRVVSYAAQKGKRRYVALFPDDAYGKLVEPSFKEAVARAGGTVVTSLTYPVDTGGRVAAVLAIVKNLHDEILTIEGQGNPVDAIFIPGGEDTVQLLGPLLKQANIDTRRIKVIGTGALDTPNVGRDDSFQGAWFASPDPLGFKDYAEKFSRAYGHTPPRISTLAYDATSLAAALATGPAGGRFIPSALTRPSGFTGVDGLFRLMSDGITDRALAILEVQKFGSTVIEQPPRAFDTSGGLPGPSSQLDPSTAPQPRGAVSRIN